MLEDLFQLSPNVDNEILSKMRTAAPAFRTAAPTIAVRDYKTAILKNLSYAPAGGYRSGRVGDAPFAALRIIRG